VQSRKEWIAAVEDGTKTKQQAIARCKAMVAKYEARGGSMHGNLWAKWLAELEAKPKAKAKAKPKASVDQSIASLSKAELVEIVQAFMSKAK
jgi:formate dehydrogenase maturation protein FdhE